MISAECDSVYFCLGYIIFWVISVSCYWSDAVCISVKDFYFFSVFVFVLSVESAD